jgi:hypothetical protein
VKDEWKADDLWDLLGHAGPVSVSPFFSRNVLRSLRQAPARPLIPVFALRWLAGGALALLTAGFFLNLGDFQPAASLASGKPADFAAAFDEAAGLNSLAAVEDVSLAGYSSDL